MTATIYDLPQIMDARLVFSKPGSQGDQPRIPTIATDIYWIKHFCSNIYHFREMMLKSRSWNSTIFKHLKKHPLREGEKSSKEDEHLQSRISKHNELQQWHNNCKDFALSATYDTDFHLHLRGFRKEATQSDIIDIHV